MIFHFYCTVSLGIGQEPSLAVLYTYFPWSNLGGSKKTQAWLRRGVNLVSGNQKYFFFATVALHTTLFQAASNTLGTLEKNTVLKSCSTSNSPNFRCNSEPDQAFQGSSSKLANNYEICEVWGAPFVGFRWLSICRSLPSQKDATFCFTGSHCNHLPLSHIYLSHQRLITIFIPTFRSDVLMQVWGEHPDIYLDFMCLHEKNLIS